MIYSENDLKSLYYKQLLKTVGKLMRITSWKAFIYQNLPL